VGAPRSLRRPWLRTRAIERWTTVADNDFANGHIDDIDGGSTTSHPNAVCVQMYALLLFGESNGENDFTAGVWSAPADDPRHAVRWIQFAHDWAVAHGDSEEDYYLHAQIGQPNNVAGITSISALGVIVFNSPQPGGGPISSYPFTPGQTIALAGLTAGNGTYPVSTLQKFGITISGWSAGALGSGLPGNSKIGTVSTPGTGTRLKDNRLQRFGWASWTLGTNFGAATARAMQVARFAQMILAGGVAQQNGVLIDSMSTGDYSGHTASVEYGPSGLAPQYVIDLASELAAILASAGAPTYLRINTAGYFFATDATLSRAAKGAHCESSLGLFPYAASESLTYVIARNAEGVDIEFSFGGTYTITNGVATLNGLPASYTAGNYATPTARALVSLYAYWLMAVDATFTVSDGGTRKHCILDLWNGMKVGQGPFSAVWPLVLDTDIGQPLAPYVKSSLIDPLGIPVQRYTRAFSHDGTTPAVFVVFLGNAGYSTTGLKPTDYGDASLVTTTLPAAPTGKAWHQLMHDGTLSAAASASVTSRRSEGLILVAT